MSDKRAALALEISPLGERHHTGIANVTKHLAKALLADDTVDQHFFFNRSELPRAIVQQAVDLEDGSILWWIAARASAGPELSFDPMQPVIGLYPGHKWHRRLFPVEVQIVHDITTLLAPRFHTEETVQFWQSQLLSDMLSSDLIVTVSESTKTDILTYYPQLAGRPCITVPLAPASVGPVTVEVQDAEPYVLVLGTLEPRKNVEVVLEALSRRSDLIAAARFVFAGHWGWGPGAEELTRRYGLQDAVASGRIVFSGFVADSVRDALMTHARCVLYVSHYEGFGLPILEALRVGAPVLTGYGSSLPEVGGDVARYCDVADPDAVAAALLDILSSAESGSAAARQSRQDWAATFDWSLTYRRIRDAAIAIALTR